MGFRQSIAATKSDWIELFQQYQDNQLLKFYPLKGQSVEDLAPYDLEHLPHLGVAENGILVLEEGFLAVSATNKIVAEKINRIDGSVRFILNQASNPDSFTIRPGGLWNNDYYVIGEMSTLHTTGNVVSLLKKIRGYVQRKFHPGGHFRIGTECYSLYSDRLFTTDYRYEQWKVIHEQS